ncbi:hypothetical protein RSAG8_09018, partial [Rhizoctonia solani AG-8 WAC10335]
MFTKLFTALLLTAVSSVGGSNGVNGQGFGVDHSTPRDGTRRNPFQMKAAVEDGTVTMTVHQISGDGTGNPDEYSPYECGVSADASGKNFAAMKVVTNVSGQNSRSNAKAQDFALVAQDPPGTNCTDGPNAYGDACVVRCAKSNVARTGPFGGCVAITNAKPAANLKAKFSARK